MVLEYLEYHVAHHCNLNCRGCGHLSNLVEEESFGDLNQFKRDLTRLSELFENVKVIRLMGGEPLLNPDCISFVETARDVFPKARISIVTNGLLLPSMSCEFYRQVKKNECRIQVSAYKPTRPLLDIIETKCNEAGVILEIIKIDKNLFFKQADPEGKNIAIKSYESCYSKGCTFLQDGKLSVCCAPFVSRLLSDKYGLSLEISNDDWIDIYDENITAEKIVAFISTAIPFCRYCSPEKQWFDWKSVGHNVSKYDWVIDTSTAKT